MPNLLFAAAALAVLVAATPADALTRKQAAAQCRSIHGGPQGVRVAERTGVSIQQRVKQCVAEKMKGKK